MSNLVYEVTVDWTIVTDTLQQKVHDLTLRFRGIPELFLFACHVIFLF